MDLEDPLELFKIWMSEAEKKEILPSSFSKLLLSVNGLEKDNYNQKRLAENNE